MQDPVAEVLAKVRNVKRVGDDKWIASSPTRRDANPSLSIRRGDDGRCLLWDFGGATVAEIVGALGMEVGELFADDGEKRRSWVTKQPTKKQYKRPELPEEPQHGEGSVKWLASRGISETTMHHFGLYTTTMNFRKAGQGKPAICYPYLRDGAVVNIKYRCPSPKDFTMVADAEPCFYNLDGVSAEDEDVLICEGEQDVMAYFEATGKTNALSPPGGAESITEPVMASAAHIFANERIKVILAGDMDDAGERMMDEIARRVGKERCFRARWPEGMKDCNETLVKGGKEAVEQAIADAEPLPYSGIISFSSVSNSLWKLYGEGMPPGHSTGITVLDKIYTVDPGMMTVVTGSPNAGKTTFLDGLMVNIAEMSDWHFGVCSMENKDLDVHKANIIAKRVRKPFGQGFRERMTSEELARAEEWVDEHFDVIRPSEPTIKAILDAGKALVYRTGIEGMVIDPWNRIYHDGSMISVDYISDALARISDFANRFRVHVWLVAHPKNLVKGPSGQYPVVTGYDISGGATFFNMADYILSLWRDREDFTRPVDFYTQKSRRDWIATLGSVALCYDRPTGRYYDLSDEPNAITAWHPQTPAERLAEREPVWEVSHAVAD